MAKSESQLIRSLQILQKPTFSFGQPGWWHFSSFIKTFGGGGGGFAIA
jgi:hypothetical protein